MKLFLVHVKCRKNDKCSTYMDTFIHPSRELKDVKDELYKETFPAVGLIFAKELTRKQYKEVFDGNSIFKHDLDTITLMEVKEALDE